MTKYVVLLRGINVGGRNSLPMRDLRHILGSLGYSDVQSYIQSGNVVLSSASQPDSDVVSAAIKDQFGFSPRVLVIPASRFEAIAEANPYKDVVDEPKHLHISFLAGAASADLDAMSARKSSSESFTLSASALYLHAPDGLARSKLANDAEKLLGVEATGRNWNTVRKLLEMLA